MRQGRNFFPRCGGARRAGAHGSVAVLQFLTDANGDRITPVAEEAAAADILSFNTTPSDAAGQVRTTVDEHGAATDYE